MPRYSVTLLVAAVLVTMTAARARAVSQPRAPMLPPEAAGFPIVRNSAPDSAVPIWRIGETPLLTIGSVAGESCTQLGNVSSFTQLPSGHIIAAWGTEVRVFSSAGRCVGTLGRRGQGPGEFRTSVRLAGANADTVIIMEGLIAATVHLYSVTRGYIGTADVDAGSLVRYGRPGERAEPVELLGGGLVLVRTAARVDTDYPNAVIQPRDSATFTLLDRNLAHQRSLGRWPRTTPLRFMWQSGSGSGILGTRGVRVSNTFVTASAGGERTCIGDAIQPAVSCFLRDGSGITITWNATPVPLPDEELRDRTLTAGRTTAPDFPVADYRRFLERIALPPHQPFFDLLHLDSEMNLWVRVGALNAAQGTSYLVFGRDGRLRARAQLPRWLGTFGIFGTELLTTRRDSLDVTYIVRLPIIRTG